MVIKKITHLNVIEEVKVLDGLSMLTIFLK